MEVDLGVHRVSILKFKSDIGIYKFRTVILMN